MLKAVILSGLMISTIAIAEEVPLTPNPEVTAGDYCDKSDPDFAGYRYEERIAYCRRSVSKYRKQMIYEAYGIPSKCRRNYTVDHFIPLSMGGSNANENLWPEHVKVKATRQELELNLYKELEAGLITQEEAVGAIVREKMNPPNVDIDPTLPSNECVH